MSYEHGDGLGQRPGGNRNPYSQRPESSGRPVSRERQNDRTDRRGRPSQGRTADYVNRTVQNGQQVRRNPSSQDRRPSGARETAAGREGGTGRPVRQVRAPEAAAISSAAPRRRLEHPDMKGNPRELLAKARIERAKQKKRRRRIIVAIVAECFTLMLIFGYAYFARRWNMIQREDFNPQNVQNEQLSVDDIKKMKGYRMIAVFGVDSRNNDVGAGNQSDVNIICCINQDTGEIKLVSLYRDTYLNINDSNSYRKFNAAYANGGPEQALKALNKNLDLDITEYVTFSWKSVADGINILGGVDVEITRSEFKYINGFITETVKATGLGSHQLSSPGLQHLDGVQAVAYGRLRLMDTDYARTERQRKIIELAFAKAKQADYATLNNILETILPNISTNLTFADMTSLAMGITKYYIGENAGFPFAKGNANMPGKGDCVIPQTLESNVSQLHTFLFGDEAYTPTDRVKEISSKIAQDSGMHQEGKPSTGSALSTESYVPKETTAEETTEAETTTKAAETDEYGNPVIHETDEYGNVVNIYPGETDENGQLIDGPIEDWPEEPDYLLPNGQNGYNPGGTNPGITNPGQAGGTHNPVTPGGTSPNDNNRIPGESGGPSSSTQPAGPSDSTQTGGNPAGTVMPGQNEGNLSGSTTSGGTTPGDTNSSGTPAGGTTPGGVSPDNPSSPGTTPSGTRPEDISGPGVQGSGNTGQNNPSSQGPGV